MPRYEVLAHGRFGLETAFHHVLKLTKDTFGHESGDDPADALLEERASEAVVAKEHCDVARPPPLVPAGTLLYGVKGC